MKLETSDLNIATVLVYNGFPLEDIYKKEAVRFDGTTVNQCIFVFDKTQYTDDLIAKYWKHEIRVEPIEFYGVGRDIKKRMYQN